jgi:hypothetical protein
MKFKANVPNTAPMSPRAELRMKYDRCRSNLLLVLLFTVVNLFTVTFGNSYFLFSATFPVLFPATMAEIAADTAYLAEMGLTADDTTALIVVGLVIGLIMTVPYLLCWIFSKKRPGWMVAALVFFSLDCLLLLTSLDLSMIADILIHGWVMFYLITGVIHGFKLKTMPEDDPLPEYNMDSYAEYTFDTFDQAVFTGEVPEPETSDDRGEELVAKEDQE